MQHDITVCMPQKETNNSFYLTYVAAKLADATVKDIAHTFAKALKIVTTQPSCLLPEADILSERDAEQIWAWNSRMPEAMDSCLHHWFEEQASFTPTCHPSHPNLKTLGTSTSRCRSNLRMGR